MLPPSHWPGPQLPLGAEPRPVELPFAERHRHGEEWFQEEECGPFELATFSEEDSTPLSGACTPPVEEACGQSQELGARGFQRLLLEISLEHRRALARQRRELEQAFCGKLLEPPEQPQEQPQEEWVASSAQPQQEASPSCARQDGPQGTESRSSQLKRMGSVTRGEAERLVSQKSVRLSPFDFTSEASAHHRPALARRGNSLKRFRSLFLDGGDASLRSIFKQGFKVICTMAIVLNSITIGWAAESAVVSAIRGEPAKETETTRHLSLVFIAFFTVEILLRASHLGLRSYFCGEDWSWNIFDLLVVGSDVVQSLLELLLPNQMGDNSKGSAAVQNLTVVRMLRILRITRALRILRIVRFFRELRMMVLSVLQSGSSLLWSCVLLGVTIYAFSVYFVQAVAFHLESSRNLGLVLDAEEHLLLEEMFGSIARAEYTLYMAVSGGISWGEVAKPLLSIATTHGLVFLFYTFFTTFALMNIITGIFVETSISSARSSQEELAVEQIHTTQGLRNEMRKIFEKADTDRSGTVNLDEFQAWLDGSESRAYLEALGVEVDKAKGLFELLDLDLSGEVTLEEFTFGCLRLKGGARSIDIATLMNHTRRMAEQWREFFRFTDEQFQLLQEFEARVEGRLALLFAPGDVCGQEP